MSTIKLVEPVRHAGYYVIGINFKIALLKKPSWLHRIAVRVVLGWKWEEA
ncbi:hypothetical protein ACCP99_08075 [Xanthomonas sp. NCPPB 3443]